MVILLVTLLKRSFYFVVIKFTGASKSTGWEDAFCEWREIRQNSLLFEDISVTHDTGYGFGSEILILLLLLSHSPPNQKKN